MVLLQPKLDFTRLLPGQESVETVNKIISETQKEVIDPFNVAITGGAALAYDELKSVSDGTKTSGMLALLLFLSVLFFAFKSISIIFAIFANLLAGLILTATFCNARGWHLMYYDINRFCRSLYRLSGRLCNTFA